jgi:hypothetical protein
MMSDIEAPKDAKKDALVRDDHEYIYIDCPWTYKDAEELMEKKMAWLDTAMRAVLPPAQYDNLHATDQAKRDEAAGYMDREGIRFKEINQCAFITVKDKIVARFDSPWRMKNGKRKDPEQP